MTNSSWTSVKKDSPCPICGGVDWCRVSGDEAVTCRLTEAPTGWRKVKDTTDGRIVYVRESESRRVRGGIKRSKEKRGPVRDWEIEQRSLSAKLTDELLGELADQLGVSASAIRDLEPGYATGEDLRRLRVGFATDADYPNSAFSFPERDERGRIIGLGFRARQGSIKGFAKGAQRGLTIPRNVDLERDPVLIVEGPSDVAAALSLGLAAVGRPSNSGGSEHLAQLLKSRLPLVLGENDSKESGAWPGKEGAMRVAGKLACALRGPVSWTLPPPEAKDLRQALHALVQGGLRLDDRSAAVSAGEKLLAAMQSLAVTVEPQLTIRTKRSGYGKVIATLAVGIEGDSIAADCIVFAELVKMADSDARDKWIAKAVISAGERAPWLGENAEAVIRELIEQAARDAVADALEKEEQPPGSEADAILGSVSNAAVFRCKDGRAFMTVEMEGVSRTFLVRSRACQTAVRRSYYQMSGRAPAAEAVQAAVNMLEARALFDGEVRVVAVRSAEGSDGSLYLDLANAAGEYVHIRPARWEIRTATPEDPVLFWQPKGVNPLPRPKRGGSLCALRELVNVQDEDWPLVVAWLVAALRPGRAFTVLIIFGEQGSGKSTGCRMIRRIIDPNVAELRAKPRDERDLAIAARNGLVVGFDNLSGLSPELSDA